MGLIAVRLDSETEAHLADIQAYEKTDKSELIRRLINERWLSLQAGQTLVERMGGHPKHLLEGAAPDLSERPNRKQAIAQYLLKQGANSMSKQARLNAIPVQSVLEQAESKSDPEATP
jgi:hypothetical protein